MDTLSRALPDRSGNGGRIFLISGEAGMGKTRLITEVAEGARSRGRSVSWSQMLEDPGAPPYLLWRLVLRSCLQQLDEKSLEEDLGTGADDIADIVPELRSGTTSAQPHAVVDSNAARYQLFDSVTRFLLRTAARQPLVILLDNLHAADRSSLALLEYVCQQIPGNPILIAAAYRESDLSRKHPLRSTIRHISRSAGCLRMRLNGLSRTEVAELLHAHLGYAPTSTLLQTVYEQSDGNPLFVSEVGSMLAAGGPDSKRTSMGFRFQVPDSLREVIVARLDRLPAGSIELLRIASVLGRNFELRLLADLADVRIDRATVLLQQAQSAGVVVSSVPGGYAFGHALFREVLYAELSTIMRVKLHSKAGELLESFYRKDLQPYLSMLAFHYFEAAQAGKVQKAVRYCRKAATSAVRQRAYGEAVALLGCAIEAAGLDSKHKLKRRYKLLKQLGQAQYQSGQLNAAHRTLMQAAILAYRQRWWERLAEALFLFQLVCQQSGYHHISSVPLHEAALENISDDNEALRARLLVSLAKAYRTAGTPERAIDTWREGIRLARRTNNPDVLLNCLRKGNWTVGRNPANVSEGLRISEEALRLAQAQHQPQVELDAIVDIVFQLCDLGKIDEVHQKIAVLRELAARERQPHFENVLLGFETSVAIIHGDWTKAIQTAQQGLRRLPLQSVFGLRGRFAFQIFVIKKLQGTLRQVQDVAGRIFALNDDSRFWLPGRVLLHCELNQPKQAREALKQLGDLRHLPRDDMYEIALVFVADACGQLRDGKRCAVLYDLLLPYRELNVTLPGTFMLGAVSTYLANLAVTTGRRKDAAQHFEDALIMNESMGALPALAQTQVSFARMLMATNNERDRKRASRLVAGAGEIAEKLGLQPVLRIIDNLSAEAGIGLLTNREREVLHNLASGLSNKRIAYRLNVSQSTVATHVRNIFRKMGVSNRTEAADYARRIGPVNQG